MTNIDVSAPVSAAPTTRLALGVGWVRPGAGAIGGAVNPAANENYGFHGTYCFAGSAE
jgi:hypothetical protein